MVRVSSAAHPMIEPTPVAVRTRMIPTVAPQNIRFTGIRALGPPKTAPRAATTSERFAIITRLGMESTFATNHPVTAADGITSTSMAKTNPSARLGRPSMSMVCMPEIFTTMIEFNANTAIAASAGADRLHTRRTSAPGRSTAGSPRARNQRSAASDSAAMGRNPSCLPGGVGLPDSFSRYAHRHPARSDCRIPRRAG